MSRIALPFQPSEFDAVADDYEGALQQGLRVSGESAEFFAQSRIGWMERRFQRLNVPTLREKAIDFGCGTGNSIQYLTQRLGFRQVVGLDPSSESLRQAEKRYPQPSVKFFAPDAYTARCDADLVFCNGVFHHIPPADRTVALEQIRDCLKPGGVFAYWENNPWNPGTRFIMKRIPFDRDAITLSIPESIRSIKKAGLDILCVDSCFYFPRLLRGLRRIEPWLCKIPLGAQYLVLSQKR